MRQVLRRVVPPRFRPLARTLYARRRRIAYGALAVVLAVAFAAAIAVRSWIAAVATLLVPLAVAAVELRRMRRTHFDLSARHDQLSRVIGALAMAQFNQAGSPPDDEMPVELVPYVAASLLENGDVLDAYALVIRRSSLVAIDLQTRRRLWGGLQARGYLRFALAVAESCVADPAGRRNRAAYEQLKAELAVLSGGSERTAQIPSTEGFTPVVGRILHIVGTSLPTTQAGYTIRTHYIATAQVAAGLDPHVVTQMGYGTERLTRSRQAIDGVTYHRVPGPPRGSVPLDQWLAKHTERVARLVSELRPAVLHAASDYVNALTARAVGDAFKLPVVYESRGFWEETWLSRQAQTFGWDIPQLKATHGLPDVYLWRREIEDRCRREADWVVTLADVMADRIEAGGVDRQRVTVIPNGVDVDAFPVQSRNRDLAGRLGIGDETTVIGYISSIVEYEGIDTLISAYAAVKAVARTRLTLLIVGDGPERDGLMRQAADLGLADAIFTGRVPHGSVLDYYSLIDIFVVPRKPVEVCHLVTPLKPFEAFATGRTVVMSNVRALAAIANQSQAAELFEAGSAESLASTLTALLEDDSRRSGLGPAGAEWVRMHRTWAATAAGYLRIYSELGAAPSPSVLASADDVQHQPDLLLTDRAIAKKGDRRSLDYPPPSRPAVAFAHEVSLSTDPVWLDCDLFPGENYRLRALVEGRSDTSEKAALIHFEMPRWSTGGTGISVSKTLGAHTYLATGANLHRTDGIFTVRDRVRRIGLMASTDSAPVRIKTLTVERVGLLDRPSVDVRTSPEWIFYVRSLWFRLAFLISLPTGYVRRRSAAFLPQRARHILRRASSLARRNARLARRPLRRQF